jgi:hypothetical protein
MKVSYGAGISIASGSMGGSTASRNRYGAYWRSKVMPVNPGSTQQTNQRSYFSELASKWMLLSSAVRADWQTYANNTAVVDALGATIHLTGQNWYVGANSLRKLAGLAEVSAAPTLFGRPAVTLPTLTVTAGDPISVAFTATDPWATATGGALLIFASDSKSPSTNYCKGPFRYAGKIAGSATPPTSPATVPAPFVYAEGQRVYWRAVALTADGRYSADVSSNTFCGA